MKYRIIGSIILAFTLVLSACGNGGGKSAETVIKDVQKEAKDVKSYHTDNNIKLKGKEKGQEQNVDVGMDVDKKNNAKLNMDQMGQKMEMYVQGKKIFAKMGKQWVDLSSQSEQMNIDKTIDQLNYESYTKTLKGFKDAKSKKTDDGGYMLTYDIKNKEDFKKLAEASGNKDQFKEFEKQVDKITGTAKLKVNKNNEIDTYNLKSKLTKDKESINMNTKVKYSKLNKVNEIKLPKETKDAKKIEEIQKEMQKQQEEQGQPQQGQEDKAS